MPIKQLLDLSVPLSIVASIVIHHFLLPSEHLWFSEVRPSPLQTTYLLFLVEVEVLEAKDHIKLPAK